MIDEKVCRIVAEAAFECNAPLEVLTVQGCRYAQCKIALEHKFASAHVVEGALALGASVARSTPDSQGASFDELFIALDQIESVGYHIPE